ncbi:acyl carrier protein [Desulfosediminicola flagellatus]|uniref:acyl carrier protein n=1 Tax=Desulfosediminicola flagellatus TaxID=2569541 RepID=UPI0010ACAC38|nr:acyl carrier protein [Desulfosediminicola flagellatus]
MKVLRIILILFLFILPTTTALYGDSDNSVSRRTDIEERFVSVLFDQMPINLGELSPETNFREDLGADDLDMLELCMAVEEYFDVLIPDKQWSSITTFESVVDLIIKIQNSRG